MVRGTISGRYSSVREDPSEKLQSVKFKIQ
jgi:hypothetical protein